MKTQDLPSIWSKIAVCRLFAWELCRLSFSTDVFGGRIGSEQPDTQAEFTTFVPPFILDRLRFGLNVCLARKLSFVAVSSDLATDCATVRQIQRFDGQIPKFDRQILDIDC